MKLSKQVEDTKLRSSFGHTYVHSVIEVEHILMLIIQESFRVFHSEQY